MPAIHGSFSVAVMVQQRIWVPQWIGVQTHQGKSLYTQYLPNEAQCGRLVKSSLQKQLTLAKFWWPNFLIFLVKISNHQFLSDNIFYLTTIKQQFFLASTCMITSQLVSINWIPITICRDSYQQCSLGTYCFKLWWHVCSMSVAIIFRCQGCSLRWSLQIFTVLWCSWFFSNRIPNFLYSKFLWTLLLAGVFLTLVLHLVYISDKKCDSLLLRTALPFNL